MKFFKYIILILFTLIFSQQSDISKLEDEINILTSEINKLKTKIQSSSNQLDAYKAEKALKEKTIILNQLKIDAKEDEIIIQKIEINKLIQDINDTKKDIKRVKEEINSLDDQIINLNIEIGEKQKKLDLNMKNIKDRLIHIYKHGDKNTLNNILFNSNFDESINLIKYLPILIESDNKLKNETQSILSELENHIIDLEKTKKQRITNKNKLLSKSQALEKNNNKLQLKIKNLEKDQTIFKNQTNEINSQITKLNKNIEVLQKQINNLEDKVTDKEVDKEKVYSELKKLIKRTKSTNNKLIDGSFDKMRGKLNWPINGKVVQKYGMQISAAHIKIPNYLIKIKSENDHFIRPIHKGIITKLTDLPGLGDVIIIDHADKKSSIYTNLNISDTLGVNDIVNENSIIGTIIDSTTPLNFGISIENKNGETDFLDPTDWLKK